MEIDKEIKRDTYAVKISLKDDGVVLGWAYVYIMYQDRHKEPYGYLENVYVEPKHRAKGLGSKLVKLAVAEAKTRGCYKIIATSKDQKTNIHVFYQKHGFVKMGVEFRINFFESKVLTQD